MSQKYFDKYDDNFNQESSCCGSLCKCCTNCCESIIKHITKQVFKLFIIFSLIGLCIGGIYWGATELKSLNDFSEVSDGCTILSISNNGTGESCRECNCDYYYNPFEFEKKRVCDSCDSVKYSYTVSAEHCGSQVLSMDDDYWNDKACGVEKKQVGQKYSCYLYTDCRGQYSFDTMYADQDELVYPTVVIVICSVLIVLILLIRCFCC